MYYDFCSLYPSVNYDTYYPLGHPYRFFHNTKGEWQSFEDLVDAIHTEMQSQMDGKGKCDKEMAQKGMYKCVVVPPTDTTIPILAAKFDDR